MKWGVGQQQCGPQMITEATLGPNAHPEPVDSLLGLRGGVLGGRGCLAGPTSNPETMREWSFVTEMPPTSGPTTPLLSSSASKGTPPGQARGSLPRNSTGGVWERNQSVSWSNGQHMLVFERLLRLYIYLLTSCTRLY